MTRYFLYLPMLFLVHGTGAAAHHAPRSRCGEIVSSELTAVRRQNRSALRRGRQVSARVQARGRMWIDDGNGCVRIGIHAAGVGRSRPHQTTWMESGVQLESRQWTEYRLGATLQVHHVHLERRGERWNGVSGVPDEPEAPLIRMDRIGVHYGSPLPDLVAQCDRSDVHVATTLAGEACVCPAEQARVMSGRQAGTHGIAQVESCPPCAQNPECEEAAACLRTILREEHLRAFPEVDADAVTTLYWTYTQCVAHNGVHPT